MLQRCVVIQREISEVKKYQNALKLCCFLWKAGRILSSSYALPNHIGLVDVWACYLTVVKRHSPLLLKELNTDTTVQTEHTHSLLTETMTCGVSAYSQASWLRLHIKLITQSVICIPGWWLQVEMSVHTLWMASQCSVRHCLTSSASLPDVKAVEARRSTLRETWGGLSSRCSTCTTTHGVSNGPQYFMDPRSPAAGPRSAHLSDDSRSAGCVWLLRLDCAHPHLSPGNSFPAAWGQGVVWI